MRRSILTEKLARRGQHIVREYSVDLLELTRVGEVMDKELPVASPDTTVAQLSKMIARGDPAVASRQGTLLVDQEGKLTGIVTRGDLVRALQRDPSGQMKVLAAGQSELAVTYADELLHDALAKMLKCDIGRLPVVQREHPERVVGYLGRASILAARLRQHQEEEIRERGELARTLIPKPSQRCLNGPGELGLRYYFVKTPLCEEAIEFIAKVASHSQLPPPNMPRPDGKSQSQHFFMR